MKGLGVTLSCFLGIIHYFNPLCFLFFSPLFEYDIKVVIINLTMYSFENWVKIDLKS